MTTTHSNTIHSNGKARDSRARHPRSAIWTACWLAGLGATSLVAQAAPLTLATVPPGSGGREPAPNVIVTVDNSGSMGSKSTVGSKMYILRDALQQTFAASNLDDDRIRLAWQSMWSCRGIPNAGAACGGKNVMKRFSGGVAGDGTHRGNFLTWVNTLDGGGNTPSHLTFKAATDYLSKDHLTYADRKQSPWASDPGVTELPVLGCRRSYQIFLTDGEWNQDTRIAPASDGDGIAAGGGNADGTAFTFPLPDPGLVLPGGTPASYAAYPVTGDQTHATRDTWGSAGLSTLADLAFTYWSRDLQPNIPNLVQPLYKVKTPATYGATTLQPFWNLKNNPATWQNLTNYTIGFGAGANWSSAPAWTGDTWGGAGYTDLVNGTVKFGDPISGSLDSRRRDLWHMALNSRGRYVYADTSATLKAAFQDILDNIIADTSTPSVSISASSSSLRTGASVYVAGYSGASWSGQIQAFPVAAATGIVSSTATWYAAAYDHDNIPTTARIPYGLDLLAPAALPSRVIYSQNGTAGIEWKWANLSATQKTALQPSDTLGSDRLDYLRGDRSKEVASSGPFRNRESRLGDIINSNIWYVGKPTGDYTGGAYASFKTSNNSRAPMIYVGANDGMLHGFQASDGVEKMAYVPKGLLGKLVQYTKPSYVHQYYVDGQPFVGDADTGAGGWKSVLVSGLGGGGKGYFILNVTNSSGFTAGNAANIAMFDNTDTPGADIGHIYSQPVVADGQADKSLQIVKMNDGKWAVVMGNGYNSTNERPVLIIHYLDGTPAKMLTPTCVSACTGFVGSANGLSAPRLIDLNSDGTVDVAYAGDLLGNLWKFDLSQPVNTSWGVAFSDGLGNGAPYFVAKTAANVRQPIMTAPYQMPHPLGGVMLAFGTGRNLTDTDPDSVTQDTMWGVWDNSAITASGSTVTMTAPALGKINLGTDVGRPAATVLVPQTPTVATTDLDGMKFYEVSRNSVTYTTTATTNRGWYLDWPATAPGLRVLHNPMFFSGTKILVQGTVPKSGTSAGTETCNLSTSAEQTYLSVFDMFTGNPASYPVFSPVDAGIARDNLGIAQVQPGDKTWFKGATGLKGRSASGAALKDLPTDGGLGARPSWREFQ